MPLSPAPPCHFGRALSSPLVRAPQSQPQHLGSVSPYALGSQPSPYASQPASGQPTSFVGAPQPRRTPPPAASHGAPPAAASPVQSVQSAWAHHNLQAPAVDGKQGAWCQLRAPSALPAAGAPFRGFAAPVEANSNSQNEAAETLALLPCAESVVAQASLVHAAASLPSEEGAAPVRGVSEAA